MPQRNTIAMDATMRSLLKERLQTSIDGVGRAAECSRSVSSADSLLRSRAGVLALICWLAAYSCSSPAPPKRVATSKTHHSRFTTSAASRHIPSLATSPDSSSPANHIVSAVPRRAAVLRSVHTSARPKSSHHLPTASLQNIASNALTRNDAKTASGRAGLSSLSHPQPRSNTWLDRLSSTLASLLRASEQHSHHKSGHTDALQHSRRRTGGAGRIHSVMQDPQSYDPIVVPRHPIVLCHGLYGFDVRGPFLGLEIHYWAKTLDILRQKVGAEVLVHGVPPTGSIQERAESLHKFLLSDEAGVRGQKLNFVAHSMGGLDVRHLLTHIQPKPEEYQPVSLTTISTPHRGSPFMDWCNANIGIGNDYIEKAIEEARAERAHLVEREHRPARTPKVPYTLKSPIFTRPKPLQGSSSLPKKPNGATKPEKLRQSSETESTADSLFAAASCAAEDLTSPDRNGSSSDLSDKVKEAIEKGEKDKDGSLPFGLSSFIGSLTTLTGSFSSYMLSLLDTPAYAMLSTKYMNEVFNPCTPNVDGVKYYSIASRTPSLAIWHPLWLPKLILDAAAESRTVEGESDGSADALGSADQGNDGLVSVESAKWGDFLGVMEGCDHWDMRGGGAPRWRQNINPSTGRPYPTKSAQQSDDRPKQSDEDKSGSSWIDINRLLFSKSTGKSNTKDAKTTSTATIATSVLEQPMTAFRSFKELAESEGWNGVSLRDFETVDDADEIEVRQQHDDGGLHESENPALSSFHPQHQDDTLVQEIASWISDRLPSGNAERRAIARRRDKLIQETGLTLYAPRSLTESVTHDKADAATLFGFKGSTIGSLSVDTATPTRSSSPSPAPASHHTAPFSTQQVVSAATEREQQDEQVQVSSRKQTQQHTEGKKKQHESKPNWKEFSELERFWIALCRHLHNQGH
ncbi:related to TGL2 - triacylglycerol lipase [Melanopsichium pennsylvanicum]|uniref:Related to TGL2 - triacylglycerol lipase n=2 Tax=Melanopsichium pennsylvanicum TaxID=63383 RepID=A0AAJ4XPA3_9BASI|nr:related to TGL2-triacylglycerol lipase [Melanopsichium pennsylvanicum 4]SNX86014.1 related to TGL2 - triacylglycerol lipase [Melanopsichium pennsylvanicum]